MTPHLDAERAAPPTRVLRLDDQRSLQSCLNDGARVRDSAVTDQLRRGRMLANTIPLPEGTDARGS